MKALTFQDVHRIRFGDVPDPQLRHERDAIVRVELAGLCGSDLHVYHGRETGLDPGTVMGHEFVGRIVRTGPGVRGFAAGDRVACPFTTSCGACYYCALGLSARCLSGRLFGWMQDGVGLHGGQAPFVRVPLADTTLFHLPDDVADTEGLLLCDVLPTGHYCARMAEAGPRGTFAVIGCGPVGLMAILAARELGADRLHAVDVVEERLAWAATLGASPVDARHEIRSPASAGPPTDAAPTRCSRRWGPRRRGGWRSTWSARAGSSRRSGCITRRASRSRPPRRMTGTSPGASAAARRGASWTSCSRWSAGGAPTSPR